MYRGTPFMSVSSGVDVDRHFSHFPSNPCATGLMASRRELARLATSSALGLVKEYFQFHRTESLLAAANFPCFFSESAAFCASVGFRISGVSSFLKRTRMETFASFLLRSNPMAVPDFLPNGPCPG